MASPGTGLFLLLVLLCSLLLGLEGRVTLYYTEDGSLRKLPEGTKEPSTVNLSTVSRPWALAYDPVESRLYFSDIRNAIIRSAGLDGSDSKPFRKLGYGAEPYGIALDNTARLLFYTDNKNKVIMMQTLQRGLTRTVKKEDVHNPRAITLDTVKGMIYYTDYGLRPRVAQVRYDGSESQTLINRDLALPSAIALDQPGGMLYWSDVWTNRIESFHLATQKRRVVFQRPGTSTFLDLKFFHNNIYFSIFNHSEILRVELTGPGPWNSSSVEMSEPLGTRVDSLLLVDDSKGSVPPTRPCNCSHICIPRDTAMKCICPDGFHLKQDETTCTIDDRLDNFLLFSDVAMDQLYLMDVATAQYHPLPIAVDNPWAVTFDVLTNRVYWTERTLESIKSARLDGTDTKVVLQLSTNSTPYGLGVDAKSKLLFYSVLGKKAIGRANLDGSDSRLLLTRGLDEPRTLQLDIQSKVIFYSDSGTPAKIGRVNYNGTDARVLYNVTGGNPLGLALDKKGGRLYWCDSVLDIIASVDPDGGNYAIILARSGTQHYALAFYRSVLYFSDLNVENIRQIGTHGIGFSVFSANEFYYIVDIHAVDRRNELELMGSSSGTTEQRNATIYFCEDGTLKKLPPGSTMPSVVNLTSVSRPWALAYDSVKTRLYFADVRNEVIRSARMDGSDSKVFQKLGFRAEPYGLALDNTARLLFYTDRGTKVIVMQTLDSKLIRVVKKEDVHSPRAITLDTYKGMIYYTDYGLRPRVAQIRYDGSESQTLIDQDVILPIGIALDQPAALLYWCDASFDRIESYNLLTRERKIILQLNQITFMDLKLFQNNLYFPLFNHSVIRRFPLDGGNLTHVEMDEHLENRVTGMILVDPLASAPARRCSCSHICISRDGRPKCICPEGLFLQLDGKTCAVDSRLDNFLLFTDVALDQLYRIDVATGQYHPLPIPVDNPWAVTFDILTNRVYWTERTLKSIKSARLDGTDTKVVLQLSTNSTPYGLGVDAKSKLLFYSDLGKKAIGRANLDGSDSRLLLTRGLDEPRTLQLDIQSKVIFYSDSGTPAKIGRVNYDGTDARVLYNVIGGNPLGLALDKKGGRLYWCDSVLDIISSVDLDGGNYAIIFARIVTQHYALAFYRSVLYFSDLNVEHINQVGTHGVGYSTFSASAFYYIVDIHAVDRVSELELMENSTLLPTTPSTPAPTTKTVPITPAPTTQSSGSSTVTNTPTTTPSGSRTASTKPPPPPNQGAQRGAAAAAGYSGGALAGAIIGTILILLLIISIVAFVLYKRRKITLHRGSSNGGGTAFFNPCSEPYSTLHEMGGVQGQHNPAAVWSPEDGQRPSSSAKDEPMARTSEVTLSNQGATGSDAAVLPL